MKSFFDYIINFGKKLDIKRPNWFLFHLLMMIPCSMMANLLSNWFNLDISILFSYGIVYSLIISFDVLIVMVYFIELGKVKSKVQETINNSYSLVPKENSFFSIDMRRLEKNANRCCSIYRLNLIMNEIIRIRDIYIEHSDKPINNKQEKENIKFQKSTSINLDEFRKPEKDIFL